MDRPILTRKYFKFLYQDGIKREVTMFYLFEGINNNGPVYIYLLNESGAQSYEITRSVTVNFTSSEKYLYRVLLNIHFLTGLDRVYFLLGNSYYFELDLLRNEVDIYFRLPNNIRFFFIIYLDNCTRNCVESFLKFVQQFFSPLPLR